MKWLKRKGWEQAALIILEISEGSAIQVMCRVTKPVRHLCWFFQAAVMSIKRMISEVIKYCKSDDREDILLCRLGVDALEFTAEHIDKILKWLEDVIYGDVIDSSDLREIEKELQERVEEDRGEMRACLVDTLKSKV